MLDQLKFDAFSKSFLKLMKSSILGFIFTYFLFWILMQADILNQIILPLSLFFIMMGLGLTLQLSDFTLISKKPKAMLVGLSAQLLLLPLLALLVVSIVEFPPYVAIGFFIIALCPSGTTSNLYSFLAKGDVALSVSLTVVVSVITPFTIPLALTYFSSLVVGEGQQIDIPVLKTIIQLLLITVLPISLGMLIRHKSPAFAKTADKPVRVFSVVFMVLIIVGIIVKNSHVIPPYFSQVGLPVLALNISAMAIGFGLAKISNLNQPQQRTIGFEVGLQNGTTALLVALTILQNAEMAVAPTVYSLTMFLTGAIFAKLLSKSKASD